MSKTASAVRRSARRSLRWFATLALLALVQVDDHIDHDEVHRRVPDQQEDVLELEHPPGDLVQALSRGIDRARDNFKDGVFSLPDLLLAIDAYRRGTTYLRELAPKDSLAKEDGRRPRVVIGVAEGFQLLNSPATCTDRVPAGARYENAVPPEDDAAAMAAAANQ